MAQHGTLQRARSETLRLVSKLLVVTAQTRMKDAIGGWLSRIYRTTLTHARPRGRSQIPWAFTLSPWVVFRGGSHHPLNVSAHARARSPQKSHASPRALTRARFAFACQCSHCFAGGVRSFIIASTPLISLPQACNSASHSPESACMYSTCSSVAANPQRRCVLVVWQVVRSSGRCTEYATSTADWALLGFPVHSAPPCLSADLCSQSRTAGQDAISPALHLVARLDLLKRVLEPVLGLLGQEPRLHIVVER